MSRSYAFLVAVAVLAIIAGLSVGSPRSAHAVATVEAPFAGSYTVTNLGSVSGLPGSYGGLTFLAGDPNTILIGGDANDALGALYSIGVVRDIDNHITGFSGTATFFADAAENDGGVSYGPGGVLFLSRYSVNEVGQTKPGSSITDKVVDLDGLVTGSPGGLNFVPAGFPGAGQLKLTDYDDEDWYSLEFAADGSGTFDITSATLEVADFASGPEGFAFVPPGSPLFPPDSLILSEYEDDLVSTFELDSNGDPIFATRTEFITGLNGPLGAVFDPLTGDFLFSEYSGEEVFVVQGFAAPAQPEPTDITLAPPTATNDVGDDHTVTATVTDGLGFPVEEADVVFEVTDGPNVGDSNGPNGIALDGNGQATFTYTGDGGAGADTIQACVVDFPELCATATKTWVVEPTSTPSPTPTPLAATATPTPTPTPTAVAEVVQLPSTGGTPSDGGSSALPWLAAIAGAIALIGSGSAWLAYQKRRVR